MKSPILKVSTALDWAIAYCQSETGRNWNENDEYQMSLVKLWRKRLKAVIRLQVYHRQKESEQRKLKRKVNHIYETSKGMVKRTIKDIG